MAAQYRGLPEPDCGSLRLYPTIVDTDCEEYRNYLCTMPDTYTYKAEGELAKLIERARAGDEVINTTEDDHKAKLVPVESIPEVDVVSEPRKLGLLRGQLRPAPDWDSDEVNEEIARQFNEGETFPR